MTPPYYQQVTVIGMGLIGSSLMRVMAQNKLAGRIIGADHDPDIVARAKTLGLADAVTTDIASASRDSDLVVLAVPVGAMGEVARTIAPAIKPRAVITDTGSTKTSVITSITPHIPPHAVCIPSHPIAGTEFSGPEAGFAELFRGRYWIITPLDSQPAAALSHFEKFLAATGALVEGMSADYHDTVLAMTSHLPHLIAYTIVGTAFDVSQDLQNDIIRFAASGFRDFTRIAASDPVMWRDVFIHNADAVLALIDRFNADLATLKTAIRQQQASTLESHFARTRSIRKRIKDIGQL